MKDEILSIYESNKNYYTKHLRNNLDLINYLNITFLWTADIKEQVYCLRNNITSQPMCKYDKCDKPANFKGMTEGYGVGGCSRKHGQFISNLEKYGYEMPLNDKGVFEKTRQSLIVNHGVSNPAKSRKNQMKRIRTVMNKNKLSDRQRFNIKISIRRLNRLSEFLLNNIPKKRDEISIKLKREETLMNNYGVRNPMQNPKISEKHSGGYKHKDYIWQTGEISRVQGFEPKVLKELEERGYTYDQVKTDKRDMPEIWYIGEDTKEHRYFPDLYIQSEHMIIEVKSDHTMLKEFHKNMLKAQAVKKLGYRYKLEVR